MRFITRFLLATSLGAVARASLRNTRQSTCDIKVNQGEAIGENVTTSDGIQVYTTGPADATIAVLLLTDIFGFASTTSQLVADSFGTQGYLTLMPDLFAGDPIPLVRPADYDMAAWRTRHPQPAIDAIVNATLAYAAASTAVERIGVVGYCFGGPAAVRLIGRSNTPSVVAGYLAHPSGVEDAEWAAAAAPLSIANAELDTTFPLTALRTAEDILRNSSIEWQLSTYSDVPHGFGVRPNVSMPRQVFAQERAFAQAVTWFDAFVRPADATFVADASGLSQAEYGLKTFAEEHAAVVAGRQGW